MGKKSRKNYHYNSQGDEEMNVENTNQVPDDEAFETSPSDDYTEESQLPPDENYETEDENESENQQEQDDNTEPQQANPVRDRRAYQQFSRQKNVVTPHANTPKAPPEMVAKMPRISPTAYNLFGLAEVASSFEITRIQLEEFAKNLFLQYIPDLIDVRIEVDTDAIRAIEYDAIDAGKKEKNNRQSEVIYGMVYIPANSPNIVDRSSFNSKSSIIPIELPQISKDVSKFMDQFCLKEWRRILKSKGRNSYVAIRFSVALLINKGFDRDGKAYKIFCDEIGQLRGEDPQCEIDIRINWDGPKCTEVESLRITKKKYSRKLKRHELNPKGVQMY